MVAGNPMPSNLLMPHAALLHCGQVPGQAWQLSVQRRWLLRLEVHARRLLLAGDIKTKVPSCVVS